MRDVLESGPLAGRWWVWGGLLLGWTREGDILSHDYNDADFAFDAADRDRFLAAAADLIRAGFAPLFEYRNNAGDVTENCFFRRGAKFEFFAMVRDEDRLHYWEYKGDHVDGPLEMEAVLSAQALVPFDFLGRTWLKHADHEAELTAIYGPWQIPDPTWSFLNERSIVARRRWSAPPTDWSGP